MMYMDRLVNVHWGMGQHAAARSMGEETVGAVRRAGAAFDTVLKVEAIGRFAAVLGVIGEHPAAMTLCKEAVVIARRVLGDAHHATQEAVRGFREIREREREYYRLCGSSTCYAMVDLVGLVGKPELNGRQAFVVGLGKGRCRVRLMGGAPSAKPLGIKPANLVSVSGLAIERN